MAIGASTCSLFTVIAQSTWFGEQSNGGPLINSSRWLVVADVAPVTGIEQRVQLLLDPGLL